MQFLYTWALRLLIGMQYTFLLESVFGLGMELLKGGASEKMGGTSIIVERLLTLKFLRLLTRGAPHLTQNLTSAENQIASR